MNTSLRNIIYMAVPNASITETDSRITIEVDTQEDATTVGIILELHT